MDTLSGSIERITFYNPEKGYTVLRLCPEHQRGIQAAPKSSLSSEGLATVVGNFYSYRDIGTGIQNTAHNSKPRFANKLCQRLLLAFKDILDQA